MKPAETFAASEPATPKPAGPKPSAIKAIIYSDLLSARSLFLQLIGICVVVGAVMCWAMGTMVSVLTIAAMAPLLYLFSVAGVDEMNGWERFRLVLPASRCQVVFGRYGSLLVVTAAAAIIAIVVGTIIGLVVEMAGVSNVGDSLFVGAGATDENSASENQSAENPPLIFALAISAPLSVFPVLVASAVALPFITRFGMTKAVRFIPLVVIFAPIIAMGFGATDPLLDFLNTIEEWVASGAFVNCLAANALILVVGLVIFAASALLSAKLYARREF